jgi:hypothetical protein
MQAAHELRVSTRSAYRWRRWWCAACRPCRWRICRRRWLWAHLVDRVQDRSRTGRHKGFTEVGYARLLVRGESLVELGG